MRTVLVADEDQAMREAVGAILHNQGFSVVLASTAERARTVLEDNPAIAGVVADATLVTEQDTQLISVLRADERYQLLPIVVLGWTATVEEIMRSLESGASRFVAKSALSQALPQEIEAVFSS